MPLPVKLYFYCPSGELITLDQVATDVPYVPQFGLSKYIPFRGFDKGFCELPPSLLRHTHQVTEYLGVQDAAWHGCAPVSLPKPGGRVTVPLHVLVRYSSNFAYPWQVTFGYPTQAWDTHDFVPSYSRNNPVNPDMGTLWQCSDPFTPGTVTYTKFYGDGNWPEGPGAGYAQQYTTFTEQYWAQGWGLDSLAMYTGAPARLPGYASYLLSARIAGTPNVPVPGSFFVSAKPPVPAEAFPDTLQWVIGNAPTRYVAASRTSTNMWEAIDGSDHLQVMYVQTPGTWLRWQARVITPGGPQAPPFLLGDQTTLCRDNWTGQAFLRFPSTVQVGGSTTLTLVNFPTAPPRIAVVSAVAPVQVAQDPQGFFQFQVQVKVTGEFQQGFPHGTVVVTHNGEAAIGGGVGQGMMGTAELTDFYTNTDNLPEASATLNIRCDEPLGPHDFQVEYRGDGTYPPTHSTFTVWSVDPANPPKLYFYCPGGELITLAQVPATDPFIPSYLHANLTSTFWHGCGMVSLPKQYTYGSDGQPYVTVPVHVIVERRADLEWRATYGWPTKDYSPAQYDPTLLPVDCSTRYAPASNSGPFGAYYGAMNWPELGGEGETFDQLYRGFWVSGPDLETLESVPGTSTPRLVRYQDLLKAAKGRHYPENQYYQPIPDPPVRSAHFLSHEPPLPAEVFPDAMQWYIDQSGTNQPIFTSVSRTSASHWEGTWDGTWMLANQGNTLIPCRYKAAVDFQDDVQTWLRWRVVVSAYPQSWTGQYGPTTPYVSMVLFGDQDSLIRSHWVSGQRAIVQFPPDTTISALGTSAEGCWQMEGKPLDPLGVQLANYKDLPSLSSSVVATHPTSVLYGANTTFPVVVNVTGTQGQPVPLGRVTLLTGPEALATGTLTASGGGSTWTATVPTPALTLGPNLLAVEYTGDAHYGPQRTEFIVECKFDTHLTLEFHPAYTDPLHAVTMTATALALTGGQTAYPAGTVDAGPYGQAPLVSTGANNASVATFTLNPPFDLGTLTAQASYDGKTATATLTVDNNLFEVGMVGVEVAGAMNPAPITVTQEVVQVLRSPRFTYEMHGGVGVGGVASPQASYQFTATNAENIRIGGQAGARFALSFQGTGGVAISSPAQLASTLRLRYIASGGVTTYNPGVETGGLALLRLQYAAVPMSGTRRSVTLGGVALASGPPHFAFEAAENGEFQFHNGSINIGQTTAPVQVTLRVPTEGGVSVAGDPDLAVTRVTAAEGGVSISGRATVLFQHKPQDMAGGVSIGGTAVCQWMQIREMSGGVHLGGTTGSPGLAGKVSMSGGVKLGGGVLATTGWKYNPVLKWIYVRGSAEAGVTVRPEAGGQVSVGGEASSQPRLNYTFIGGPQVGGSATVVIALTLPSSGGVAVAGGCPPPRLGLRSQAAAGGVAVGGAAQVHLTKSWSGKGGARVGGAADYTPSYHYVPSYPRNRVFIAGSAYCAKQHYDYEMTGGVLLGSSNQATTTFCKTVPLSYPMVDVYPYDQSRFPRGPAKVAAITAFPTGARTNRVCSNRLQTLGV